MGMRYLGIVLLAVLATGCSTSTDPEALAQNDPYEATNRAVFDFNMKMDKNLAKPAAKFYNHAVPQFARTGLHNFLANLNKPVTLGNDMLQANGPRVGETLVRMIVNTTAGLGGFIDVATKIGLPDHDEDFGQTLAVWGAGEGPYLMLPFLGPDPPRDLTGDVTDIFLDPFTYVKFHGADIWYASRATVSVLDIRAANIDTLEQVERTSIDFYATTRSLYRQYRNSEIRNGAPAPDAVDDSNF